MLGRILLWIIMAVWWVALMYYSGPLVQLFGRSARAEQYLWGTKNAIVLFWFLIIVMWVLVAFGVFEWMSSMDNTGNGF